MVRLFGLGSKPKTFEFKCADCGAIHRGSPSFSLHRPEHMFDVPEQERADRVTASDDLCTIRPPAGDLDGTTTYWIRATLDVPIHDVEEPFCWGMWVSQSKESFDRYERTYGTNQSGDGSFGWCPVPMKYYRKPNGDWPSLQSDVEWGLKGKRPTIILWESDEQFAVDQREGISWEKAVEIATLTMHGN